MYFADGPLKSRYIDEKLLRALRISPKTKRKTSKTNNVGETMRVNKQSV